MVGSVFLVPEQQWEVLVRMWWGPFRCCLCHSLWGHPQWQMCPHLEWCHFCCIPVPVRQALNKCWDFLTGDHVFRSMQCLTSSASFLLLSWMLLPISFCLQGEYSTCVPASSWEWDTLLHCLPPLEAESCDSFWDSLYLHSLGWLGNS